MSAAPLATGRPLLDMLGARWRVGAAAGGVAWDRSSGLAGFALNDGTLALAYAVWEGAPALRQRQGGGAELVPGTAPAPPVARVPAHRGACLAVVADPAGGFLTGGTDGRVTRVQQEGTVQAIAHLDGPVGLVATGSGQWRVCASGRAVHRLGGTTGRLDLPKAAASLALDPSGTRLAIGYDGGITLWAGGDSPRTLEAAGIHSGLCWHDTLLASSTSDAALHAWRMPGGTDALLHTDEPVTALAASASRDTFVAGLGGRMICWRVPDEEASVCGVPNQAAVSRIACHPRRPLVAAGYANGTVVLCQPGSSALLFLRAAGEGAVTALAFSPSGSQIGIGTNGGEIAVLGLPDLLFRDHASQR